MQSMSEVSRHDSKSFVQPTFRHPYGRTGGLNFIGEHRTRNPSRAEPHRDGQKFTEWQRAATTCSITEKHLGRCAYDKASIKGGRTVPLVEGEEARLRPEGPTCLLSFAWESWECP